MTPKDALIVEWLGKKQRQACVVWIKDQWFKISITSRIEPIAIEDTDEYPEYEVPDFLVDYVCAEAQSIAKSDIEQVVGRYEDPEQLLCEIQEILAKRGAEYLEKYRQQEESPMLKHCAERNIQLASKLGEVIETLIYEEH